jgi:hypothetical protein
MAWFTGIRALVFLRRGVKALERIAAAHESLASVAQVAFDAEHPVRRPTHRSVDFGLLDVDEANKVYHQGRVERGEEEA